MSMQKGGAGPMAKAAPAPLGPTVPAGGPQRLLVFARKKG